MKLFVISDVHSYFDEMIQALNKAGFDKNNDEHYLISLGDEFDRGTQSNEVFKYLISLPRAIFVKGNHLDLLVKCCERGYPLPHDKHNGTTMTIWDMGCGKDFEDRCISTFEKIRPFLNKTVNYFETANYIFVHSFIPVINKDGLPGHYTRSRRFEFNPDWRNADQEDWDAATWGNPFDMAEKGLNQTGKVIVFGHWHCSTGWAKAEGREEFGDDAKFDPYYGDGFIAVDACTAYSGKVNVLVLEDEFIN